MIFPFIARVMSPSEEKLMDVLFACHAQAAQDNPNASRVVAEIVGQASDDLAHALAAAILTTGGRHAPLRQAREILRFATVEQIKGGAGQGLMIPGFGNSFYRDEIDPAFVPLWELLVKEHSTMAARIEELRHALWSMGKCVHPNAAILTAAVCELVEVPDGCEVALFVMARLPVWTMIFNNSRQQNVAVATGG